MKEKELFKKFIINHNKDCISNEIEKNINNRKFIYFRYNFVDPIHIKLILTFKFMNFNNSLYRCNDNYSAFITLIINTCFIEKKLLVLATNYIILNYIPIIEYSTFVDTKETFDLINQYT